MDYKVVYSKVVSWQFIALTPTKCKQNRFLCFVALPLLFACVHSGIILNSLYDLWSANMLTTYSRLSAVSILKQFAPQSHSQAIYLRQANIIINTLKPLWPRSPGKNCCFIMISNFLVNPVPEKFINHKLLSGHGKPPFQTIALRGLFESILYNHLKGQVLPTGALKTHLYLFTGNC